MMKREKLEITVIGLGKEEAVEPEVIPVDIVKELPIATDKKLTGAEFRLLTVLASPENRMKTVTEICQLADIHRDTYYNAFKRPHFIEANNQLAIALVRQAATPLVHAGLNAAMQGSYQHWKVLMEMAQLYDPKRLSLETDETGEVTIRFADPHKRLDVTPPDPE